MSDGMERDKAEMLAAKERQEEEEEMKRELLDMKMYEAWYTYNDMKEILGFINESKDMANIANGDKNTQKELSQSTRSDCSLEAMPKTNLAQESEIQEHNDTSQSTHLYRSNVACNSPDLAASITDSRNPAYIAKNIDSEDMFVKLQDNSNMRDSYPHSTSRYISLKSKNSLQDSDVTNNTDMNMDANSECNQKLESWQINPLDAVVSENDVPLKEPDRPITEDHMPCKLYKEAQTPEMLEKLLPALNIRLKQAAESWNSGNRSTNTKFQWGSPIQVGHPNNSSDTSLTNTKTEHDKMECTSKCYNERPNKRKSASILSSPNLRYSSSDEDENVNKKMKMQSHEDASRVLHSHKEISAVPYSETGRKFNLNNDNINKLFDNEHKMETIEHFSNELPLASQRNIKSPNVRKNINEKREHVDVSQKSPLAHSSNDKQNAIASKEKNDTLTTEKSFMELENDSANVKTPSENIEIKPLPIKGLTRRIKNECMVLEKIQLEKQKKIEIEKEEVQRKENAERKKREEFYKKQIEERQRREKLKEEKEKNREEKSKKWNNIVDMKHQKKISKEDKEKLQGLNRQSHSRTIEIADENRALQESSTLVTRHMEVANNYITNNVNCPICNKSFPSDKIETHAAECEQYTTENEYEDDLYAFECKSPPGNINNSEILECGVCSKYRTTNGIHYEEHVHYCLQRQHEKESLNEYSSIEIDNVPNSPVRCYRPISEQNDSNIDYRRQFPSNSRTQVHSNRKRKR